MHKLTVPTLKELRTRTSEKWREYSADVLPLFVAEMDFALAEPIAEALTAAIRRSDTGYAGVGSTLPDAFAAFAERRWNWRVDPAQVSTTTDVSVVIVESLRLAIASGDGVVINPPVYAPFSDLVAEAGGRVVEVPLLPPEGSATEGWALDLDGLEAAFAAGARAYLLCSPHNPVGLVHSAEQLTAVAELATRYDVTVISDEIHAPLTHSTTNFTAFLSVSDAAREHGITAASASKAWNLAGLKCAMFVTASQRMSRLLSALPEEVHFRTSLFGRIAATAAFTEGEPWLDAALETIESNAALLASLLDERMPRIRYRAPRASYLAWLDCRGLDWGNDPSVRALSRARVALNSGQTFGTQGRGFARLNFACSPDTLTEAVTRLAAAG
ncbi:MalY/PatB family protein [Leifsonia sp. Root112D2]|uniref:MalY/PatB family protein n=1 Tax=Leifsonia sp. Root112D2 TaxID=1736426 RepID=UPI000B2A2BEB|nr:aminotransferase class I/II-fold pyridoxal phosphate-dependent enzyme [Leifsonia sp. Root112D2]